jgi:hypothetical protein
MVTIVGVLIQVLVYCKWEAAGQLSLLSHAKALHERKTTDKNTPSLGTGLCAQEIAVFIPTSIHSFDHLADKLRHLCLNTLQIKITEDEASAILLKVWGHADKKSLRLAIKSMPASAVDQDCSPEETGKRQIHQSRILVQALKIYGFDATSLTMLWNPTGRSKKPERKTISGGVGEDSHLARSGVDPALLTFDNLISVCHGMLIKRDWEGLGQFAIIAIATPHVTNKEPFWESLKTAAFHDIGSRLNLGLALMDQPPPHKDTVQGAHILRNLDPDQLTPRMRELRLIYLSQFEMGVWGGRKDPKASRQLIAQAAREEGSALGTYQLAIIHLQDGDFEEGERLLHISANAGFAEAKMSLARMMLMQQSAWDFQTLKQLLTEAAADGIEDAIELLPELPKIKTGWDRGV